MAQQHAAARSHNLGSRSSGNVMPLGDVQGLVNTGAARAFDSLQEIMERRPIKIPQLVDTLDATLTILDVSTIFIYNISYSDLK